MTDETSPEPARVEDVINDVDELAARQPEVCVGDLLDDFGSRSFGPLLMVFALVALTPIGGIPGAPTTIAAILALIALQLLFGKDHIWLPGFIQSAAVGAKKLHKAVRKLRGVARWLDEHSRNRLMHLTTGVWLKVAAVAIIMLALLVPPLEFLPFASAVPMLAIAAMGLALVVRDGLAMLAALGLAAAIFGTAAFAYVTFEEEVTEAIEDADILPE